MLSRGRAGIRGQSLIINLPGSLKAVRENFEVVLPVIPHALEKILGETSDCGEES
jgi:molybdopterin biosynthesis enzyme MoaB